MDCCFPTMANSSEKLTALTVVDQRAGAVLCIYCRQKGSQDEYQVQSVNNFIKSLGRAAVMLKVDPGNSTKDIANAVRAEKSIKGQPTQVQTTPKGSKGSPGLAEVTYSVAAQLRTMRTCFDFDEHMKIEITPNHNIVPWMVRHCNWLLLR